MSDSKTDEPVAEQVAELVAEEKPADVLDEEPFTMEKGKERAVEAVDRVKQASKEITTRPLLDAIGNYVYRAVDGLIGLAEGMEGKVRKKDRE